MNTASVLIHSLGWSLVHSLWQGALIFAALRLVLFFSPGMNARLKYHCSLVSLGALLCWFLATYLQEWQKLQTILVKVTEGASTPNKEYYITTLPSHNTVGFTSLFLFLERSFPLIISIYIIGVFFLTTRFAVNLWQVQSWKRNNVFQPPAFLADMLEELKARLDMDKKIRLFISEKIQVPVMFGTLKPVILLPVSAVMQLTTDQLEAILIHELAHIRRGDYLINILQTAVETLLFFNPFMWMISGFIRREREHCCDDLVLTHTHRPLPYAKALAALDAFRLQSTPALAAIGQKNHLLNRIKRIMEMKKQSFRNSHVLIACALIVALVLSVIWLTPAIAQNKKQVKKEQPKPEKRISIHADDEGITIDSNGVTRTYDNMDEVPPHVKKQVEETVVPAAMEAAANAMEIANEAMKEVDVAAIVSDAMASVNWEEINEEVNKAMKEVDWEEIKREVAQAMKDAGKELNDPKLKREIREEMVKAQAEVRKAMAEAKADAANAREEAQKAAAEVKAARANGASEAEIKRLKAKRERLQSQRDRMQEQRDRLQERKEMREAEREQRMADAEVRRAEAQTRRQASTDRTNKMLQQMEADGLLNRNEGYSILKSDNTLIINGKQQDKEVLKKYENYLTGDNVIIRGKEKQISIIED